MTDFPYLKLIIGPMFSNKTTKLLEIISTASLVNLKCLYVNHISDNRSIKNFSTHNGLINVNYNFDTIKIGKLANHISTFIKYDIICFDEYQFYSGESDTAIISDLVTKYSKYVVIASLHADSNKNPFGSVLKLIPIADDVEFKHAICSRCAKKKLIVEASNTFKLSSEKNQILVGGRESYIPLCRKCWEYKTAK